MNLTELQKRLGEVHDEMQEIINLAESEKRDMTDEENQRFSTLSQEFDKVEAEILARDRLEKQEARKAQPLGTISDRPKIGQNRVPEAPETSVVAANHVYATPRSGDGKFGFRTLGEFAQKVRSWYEGRTMDNRLSSMLATPTTYSQEGIGADGGFAVPPDFRAAIMKKVEGETSLLERTNRLTTASNIVTIPKSEVAPWDTTNGLQATWEGENTQIGESKVQMKSANIQLNKLAMLVPVSPELLEDAPLLTTYLQSEAADKIGFAINLAIVQGNGVGKPLGLLNSPDLISVAKETSQDADSLVPTNVIKMYSRMYAPWRSNAVWLVNQDVEPEMLTFAMPGKDITGTYVSTYGAGTPVTYMPPGGLSASPFGTLLGRPVIPTQACETLGDKGDIFFAALDQYWTITKVGGVQQDTSIHLYFDYHMVAFRFILRMAGQSRWSSTIAARDGSATYGAFITLDERA